MMSSHDSVRAFRITFAALIWALLFCAPAWSQTTVMFQQGVDGYVGTTDVFIGLDDPEIPGGGDGNVVGSTIEEFFLDGRYFAEQGDIQEIQLLLRFDDLTGAGMGQIPAGARISNATLTLHGGVTSSNARSGGPYGVAQLLVPFSDLTTWNDLGGDGATFLGGENTRPADRGFKGGLEADTPVDADVTLAVQDWVHGAANEGLVVRAGTTDGWQIFTTGATDPNVRPKLTVTYEVDPMPPVRTVVLQNGPGYNGTTMAWLQQNDTTTDGSTLDREFLDGPNAAGTSPDDRALIKFDAIFASQGGPIPDDAPITEAHLVLDTADGAFSVNVGTNGNYAVHQMLVDWNLTSLFSDFGGDGPDEAGGEIGPPTDQTGALIADARTHLDVTDAVKAWQSGAANFGLNVRALDTSDGWAIHWLGSGSPPQLIVRYAVPEPGTLTLVALAGLCGIVAVHSCRGRAPHRGRG